MILRWDVVNDWRKMLNSALGMAIGLFCIENLMMPKPYYGAVDPYSMSMYDGCMTIVLFAMMFYLMYGTTTILNNMRTKQERISTLMLPGTNLEKFLSKLTKSLIIFALLAVAAFLIADGARMLVAAIFHHVTTDSLLPYMWVKTCLNVKEMVKLIGVGYFFLGFAGWVFGASLGTLGGVIFNRNPFVMCALVVFVTSTVFGVVTMNLDGEAIVDLLNAIDNASTWAMGCIQLVLALGVFYLSYRLFCRLQAVNNKFLNL